jgi:hypothetical protein
VAVLWALLAGGPIDDPAGHAVRVLLRRMGRTDYGSVHAVLSGLVDHGLVERRFDSGRVVHLAAVPDALSPMDRKRLWPRNAVPVDGRSAGPPGPAPPRLVGDGDRSAGQLGRANATGDGIGGGPDRVPLTCGYVYPDDDSLQKRRGQRCRGRAWTGSDQWCWHHDPAPFADRTVSGFVG